MAKAADAAAAPARAPLWTLPFILLFVATFCFWLQVFANHNVLPLYLHEHGTSLQLVGFVIGSGSVGAVAGRIFSGRAIDRLGPKYFLLAGLLLWAVSMALTPVVSGLALFVSLRLVQGVGVALFMNAALGFVPHLAPASRRGAAMSFWGMTNNLGTVIGSIAGVGVANGSGYTTAFLAAAGAGAIAALLGSCIPAPPLRAVSAVRADRPRFYTDKAVLPGLVGGGVGFAVGGFTLFAPFQAMQLGLGNAGIYVAAYGAAMLFARFLFTPLSDRKGRGWAIVPGLLLVTAAMALAGTVTNPAAALAAPLLFGLGLGGSMPGLLAWTMERAGDAERATASSTFYLFYDIFGFVGTTLFFLLTRDGASAGGGAGALDGRMAYLAAALVLVASLVTYVLASRPRESRAPSTAGTRP